jgi:hypothetical protein
MVGKADSHLWRDKRTIRNLARDSKARSKEQQSLTAPGGGLKPQALASAHVIPFCRLEFGHSVADIDAVRACRTTDSLQQHY